MIKRADEQVGYITGYLNHCDRWPDLAVDTLVEAWWEHTGRWHSAKVTCEYPETQTFGVEWNTCPPTESHHFGRSKLRRVAPRSQKRKRGTKHVAPASSDPKNMAVPQL